MDSGRPSLFLSPLPAGSGTQPRSLVESRATRTDGLAPPIAAAQKIFQARAAPRESPALSKFTSGLPNGLVRAPTHRRSWSDFSGGPDGGTGRGERVGESRRGARVP